MEVWSFGLLQPVEFFEIVEILEKFHPFIKFVKNFEKMILPKFFKTLKTLNPSRFEVWRCFSHSNPLHPVQLGLTGAFRLEPATGGRHGPTLRAATQKLRRQNILYPKGALCVPAGNSCQGPTLRAATQQWRRKNHSVYERCLVRSAGNACRGLNAPHSKRTAEAFIDFFARKRRPRFPVACGCRVLNQLRVRGRGRE